MTNVNAVNAETIAAVVAAKGLIKDDHTSNGNSQLCAVATLDKGKKQHVVALYKDTSFSINEVYVHSDGTAHLSQASVGGVIRQSKGDSIEDAVKAYNDMQPTLIYSCGTLNNLTFC